MSFGRTNTRITITQFYSVTGEEPMASSFRNGQMLSPVAAQFTFKDGKISDMEVTGALIRKSGEVSERLMAVPGIYHWDKNKWPEWLHDMYEDATQVARANSLSSVR